MTEDLPVFPIVCVECYAGHRGEETPRRFWLGDSPVDIIEVTDNWLAPDHRYFKVRDQAGHQYILRHDAHADRWELTWFRRGTHTRTEPP